MVKVEKPCKQQLQEIPDNIREWSAHMADEEELRFSSSMMASVRTIAASKLKVAEEIEGAQCLIVNSKINARMVEIAGWGHPVFWAAPLAQVVQSVQTYAMSDLE